MTTLTRRRADDQHLETWHIYSEDVRIGTIGRCAGVPGSSDQWSWSVGFYPGMEPSQQRSSSAASFEEARAAFERVWQQLEPQITDEQYERWRRDRDFHAWKARMWDAGRRLPPQNIDGRSTCFCGDPITTDDVDGHIQAAHRGIGA